MNDTEILALFSLQKEKALEAIAKKYGGLCYSIAYRIMENREDAEECVNDTYLKLWDALADVTPDNLSGYLCQITRRLALNRQRAKQTLKRGGAQEAALEELVEVLSDKETPEDKLMNAELIGALNRFLAMEKPRERQIFLRRYWFYESVEAIAEQYSMNRNSVATILFRMRSRLKKFLLKEGYDL